MNTLLKASVIFHKQVAHLALSLIFLLSSQTVLSASQGQLGGSSNANLNITLTLGLFSRITGLSDFSFGNWVGGDLSANDNLCIGLWGTGTRQYRIRATGDGNGSDINAFALSNGTDFLPYRVFFNDQTGTVGQVELSSSSALLGQTAATGSFANLFGCFIENANIALLIENSSLSAVNSGSYFGLLTLTLIPE